MLFFVLYSLDKQWELHWHHRQHGSNLDTRIPRENGPVSLLSNNIMNTHTHVYIYIYKCRDTQETVRIDWSYIARDNKVSLSLAVSQQRKQDIFPVCWQSGEVIVFSELANRWCHTRETLLHCGEICFLVLFISIYLNQISSIQNTNRVKMGERVV